MEYRREIDGLRAIAVLPVILFHGGFQAFAGGYVGVDVFFVISGYLITLIILGELAEGHFSLVRFYERRVRRILPALFFMMLCCLPFAWAWMVPQQFHDFARAIIAVVFFFSNILFWRTTGYFEPQADENPLLHTWSLAIEEQFYIVFPVFLLLFWRFGRKPLVVAGIAATAASLLLAEWGWRTHPEANFYLLPTRAWEFGVGALCAFALHRRERRDNKLLAALGLGLIVIAVFAFDGTTPFPSLWAALPVGGAALVILYGSTTGVAGRILAAPALVGIGLISYSAYLWHQPLFAFARIRSMSYPSPSLMLGLGAASLVLAYLTWRYVELPFRRKPALPAFASPGRIFSVSLAAAACFVAFGLFGVLSDGRQHLWISQNPERAAVYTLYEKAREFRGVWFDDGACRFNLAVLGSDETARILDCAARHGGATAVIGDSHGVDLFNGLYVAGSNDFLVGITADGCRPHSPRPQCPYPQVEEFVAGHPEVFETILYTQAGFHLLTAAKGVAGRSIFRRIPENAPVNRDDYRIRDVFIERVARYLDRLGTHTQVIWIGPRIEPHIYLNFMLRHGCDRDYALRPGLQGLFLDLDATIDEASKNRDYTYVSQAKVTAFDIRDDFINCDVLYWADGDHWSVPGAARFVERLLESWPGLSDKLGDASTRSLLPPHQP